MHQLGRVVVALALVEGGRLTFDGGRALTVGDYVNPSAERHDGRLGPWSDLFLAVGIEPRSTLAKSIPLGLGLAWLAVIASFLVRMPWAWSGMLVCAALGSWYLPVGTLSSAAQIGPLMLPDVRGDPADRRVEATTESHTPVERGEPDGKESE